MHGYDLRKKLRGDFGLLSSLSFGSLYPALGTARGRWRRSRSPSGTALRQSRSSGHVLFRGFDRWREGGLQGAYSVEACGCGCGTN